MFGEPNKMLVKYLRSLVDGNFALTITIYVLQSSDRELRYGHLMVINQVKPPAKVDHVRNLVRNYTETLMLLNQQCLCRPLMYLGFAEALKQFNGYEFEKWIIYGNSPFPCFFLGDLMHLYNLHIKMYNAY